MGATWPHHERISTENHLLRVGTASTMCVTSKLCTDLRCSVSDSVSEPGMSKGACVPELHSKQLSSWRSSAVLESLCHLAAKFLSSAPHVMWLCSYANPSSLSPSPPLPPSCRRLLFAHFLLFSPPHQILFQLPHICFSFSLLSISRVTELIFLCLTMGAMPHVSQSETVKVFSEKTAHFLRWQSTDCFLLLHYNISTLQLKCFFQWNGSCMYFEVILTLA